jgi:hypothetical protein
LINKKVPSLDQLGASKCLFSRRIIFSSPEIVKEVEALNAFDSDCKASSPVPSESFATTEENTPVSSATVSPSLLTTSSDSDEQQAQQAQQEKQLKEELEAQQAKEKQEARQAKKLELA